MSKMRFSNDPAQLALFPFSQVLPMKLKREWAAAISKPIGKGFAGNGAQRSSKYYTHIIARFYENL